MTAPHNRKLQTKLNFELGQFYANPFQGERKEQFIILC